MDTIDSITGLFDARIRIDAKDIDGDIRIEISEPDAVAEIYIPSGDLDDLIDRLIAVRDGNVRPSSDLPAL